MKNLPSGVPIPGAGGVKSLPTGVEIPGSGVVKNLPTGLELAPPQPIEFAAAGTISAPAGAIPKPAGLAASPYRFFCVITWFTDNVGPPTIPGWTLVDWISDLRAFDQTATALLFIDVADGSAAPADFTPADIGNWLGQIFAVTGDINAVYSSATQATFGTDTVAPGPLSAPSNGSLLVMAGGCWNFSAWQESGFGGSQIYPPGFVPTLGSGNASELGGFYLEDAPAGAIDTTFGTAIERFAVVAAIFSPP